MSVTSNKNVSQNKSIVNNSEPKMSSGNTRMQWAMAILVNSIVFTYGLQSGWISPMTKILQSEESPVGRSLSDSEISLIAGIPSLTAMAGIPILLYVVDTFGRKPALYLMSVFQLACWVIKVLPANPTSLLVARVFSGLGAGGCFVVVPLYIKEISQDNIRGALGSITVMLLNVGILTMYALGSYLDYYTALYLVIGLPVLTIALLFKSPESPPFLVKKQSLEEAAVAVAYLRSLDVNDKEVQAEIDTIMKDDDYFKSIPKVSFFNIFKEKAWRRGFIIMVCLVVNHGCNGALVIVNFAATLLSDSQLKISPELQTLSIPVFMILGTLITMSLIDRLGRKLFLGGAFFISAIALFCLGTSILLRSHNWAVPGWLNIVAIWVTVCAYGAGVNPVPVILASELFNFQVRAKLMSCLSFLAWFMIFVQLTGFTAITSSLGAHISFYIFTLLNVLGAALVLLLPETKGKSMEQIEQELRKEKKLSNVRH